MKTVSICGKTSDMFGLSFEEVDYNGYVPSGFGIGAGDYIQLDIDIETGRIIDWDKDKFYSFIDSQIEDDEDK